MKILLIFLIFTISSFVNMANSQNVNIIETYRWENRILLVFASENSDRLKQQIKLFEKYQQGMDERDLIVFEITENQVESPGGELLTKDAADALRKKYAISPSHFRVILIGKDGTEKLRQDETLTIDKLFATIDAMPMRRREMREKEGG